MKWLRALLAGCCAALGTVACSENADTGPRVVTMTVTLLDSLANRGVDSQWVVFTIGQTRDSARTNQAGAFAITMPPGEVRVTYTDFPRYENLERTFLVRRDTVVVARLTRSFPYLRDFTFTAAGSLEATIVDLQGAATIAQDNATWVVYNYGDVGQSSAIQGPQWQWTAVDSVTWRVSVPTPATTVAAVLWNVMDDRYATGFYCVVGQATCTPDAP